MPQKKVITSDAAPAAVGPYSQAIQNGKLIFLSGQLPLDPKTGAFAGETIEVQTRQSLENIKSVLSAVNLTLSAIVKTTVFLKDIQDFPKMNAVYQEYFAQDPPARSCVQVAALPMNALVEIESVAVTD